MDNAEIVESVADNAAAQVETIIENVEGAAEAAIENAEARAERAEEIAEAITEAAIEGERMEAVTELQERVEECQSDVEENRQTLELLTQEMRAGFQAIQDQVTQLALTLAQLIPAQSTPPQTPPQDQMTVSPSDDAAGLPAQDQPAPAAAKRRRAWT